MSKPRVLITAIDGHTGTSIAQHIVTNPAVKDALGDICGLAESRECKDLKDKGIHVQQVRCVLSRCELSKCDPSL